MENQVEVCNDDFEDEDLKALEDEDEGQRINAFDAVYLSLYSKELARLHDSNEANDKLIGVQEAEKSSRECPN